MTQQQQATHKARIAPIRLLHALRVTQDEEVKRIITAELPTQVTDAMRPTTGKLPVVVLSVSPVFQICVMNPSMFLSATEQRTLLNVLGMVYRGKIVPGPDSNFYKIDDLFLHPSETWRVMCHATLINEAVRS